MTKSDPQPVSSPFTPEYWRRADAQLRNPRALTLAGIVCAISIVMESLPIYLLGPSLKIYFSFLATGLGCYVYGPVLGMLAGGVTDTLAFLLAGYGEPYFPGYLLTAMLSGLIYGVLLYGRPVRLPRVIAVKTLINYGSNVLLGSVWKAMLYGKGYYFYFSTGLVKNTLLLPVEVALLYLVLRFAERQQLARRYIYKS